MIEVILVLLALLGYYLYSKTGKGKKVSLDGPNTIAHTWRLFRKPMSEVDQELYQQYKHQKVYSAQEGLWPIYYVTDPDLIRDVLVKDFHIFPNHRTFPCGLFGLNLFQVKDDVWKRIRSLVSPTFTSGKLRQLTSPINSCIDTLLSNLGKTVGESKVVNIRDVFGAFSLDVITASAYGVRVDSLNNPSHPMITNAKAFFKPSLRFALAINFSGLFRKFNLSAFESSVIDFWKQLTTKLVEERRQSKVKKHSDFLQLLVETETATGSSDLKSKTLTLDEMTAQGIVFFIAGYETTSSTLAFVAYLLAKHPEVQEKLFAEVDGLKEVDHESVQELKYLEAVINETLRLYPALPRLEREAKKDYVLGKTGVTIPKGAIVSIPTYSIQRDPEHFPDPEAFKPERFLKDNVSHHPYAFHPFGTGPRICVGMRFALDEMKMCLARLVKQYRFELAPETKVEFGVGTILITSKEMQLRVELRNNNFCNN